MFFFFFFFFFIPTALTQLNSGWTPEHLSQASDRIPVLMRVKETDGATVLNYVDGQPYETWLASDGTRSSTPTAGVPYRPHNLTMAEFWARAAPSTSTSASTSASQAGPGRPFFYYNSHISALGPAGRDLGALGPVAVALAAGSLADAEVHLWLGSRGVTAHTHYDTSDNVYLQLSGDKAFTLRPPDEHWALGLYPALHAGYRHVLNHTRAQQCAGDTYAVAADRSSESGLVRVSGASPACAATGAFTVLLRPGDVLTIPRYWLHGVRAETTSVSANLWINSAPYFTAERMYAVPLPFEEEWTTVQRAVALATLTDILVPLCDVDTG
jgi:hypothetical protein